jgi:Fe-S-cluster containining protein
VTTQLPILHNDKTAFSYTCNACSRCCYDKRILVNPYELARLARNRGISTTQFIAEFTEAGGTSLKVRADGGCAFLGGEGCTVHADRPLVCRLYPLGRVVQPDKTVTYVEVEPHPQTAGTYGAEGTVAAYVESQGTAPYIAASDRYYAVLIKLSRAFDELKDESTPTNLGDVTNLETPDAEFIDVDAAVGADCQRTGEPFPGNVEYLIDRHLQLLERWVGN